MGRLPMGWLSMGIISDVVPSPDEEDLLQMPEKILRRHRKVEAPGTWNFQNESLGV